MSVSQTHVSETHVCPVHGQSSIEQVQQVLSRLSDEDLRVLTDTEPQDLAAALAIVSGTRCLVMIRDFKASTLSLVLTRQSRFRKATNSEKVALCFGDLTYFGVRCIIIELLDPDAPGPEKEVLYIMRKFTFLALLAATIVAIANIGNAQTTPVLVDHPFLYTNAAATVPLKLILPDGVVPLDRPIDASITQTTLVTIKNPNGVLVNGIGGMRSSPFNGACAIGWRGMAIAIGARGPDYYLIYEPKPGDMANGECGSGATTFLNKDTFDRLKRTGDGIVQTRGTVRQ